MNKGLVVTMEEMLWQETRGGLRQRLEAMEKVLGVNSCIMQWKGGPKINQSRHSMDLVWGLGLGSRKR